MKKTTRKKQRKAGGAKKESRYAHAKMNPEVHFEFPMDKPRRISKFYKKAFGWNIIDMGKQHGHYLMVQTGETDKEGMIKENGMINGGFFHRHKKLPVQTPSVVIAVFDIEEAIRKIKKAGGKMLSKPEEIPGIGTSATFKDTEGNRISILDPTDEWKERTR